MVVGGSRARQEFHLLMADCNGEELQRRRHRNSGKDAGEDGDDAVTVNGAGKGGQQRQWVAEETPARDRESTA